MLSAIIPSHHNCQNTMRPMHGLRDRCLMSETDGPQKKRNFGFRHALYNECAQLSHSTHMGDSTSNTMELASIHAWSSWESMATVVCHLFDARTRRFCQRKTV